MKRNWITELYCEGNRAVRAFDRNVVAREMREGECKQVDYEAYLKQAMTYVEGSAARLLISGQRLLPTHPLLGRALMEKSREETNHDIWAFDDLRALGRRPAEIRGIPLTRATRTLSQWSSHVAEYGNPMGFFGIAFVLEYLAAERGSQVAHSLRSKSAIPGIRSATRFIAGHADADPGHVHAIVEAIRQVRNPSDTEAILDSARVTRLLYPAFFQRAAA